MNGTRAIDGTPKEVPFRTTGRRGVRQALKRRLQAGAPGRAALLLYQRVREDRDVNNGSWLSPGFQAVAIYRFGAWHRSRSAAVRGPCGLLYTLLFTFVRNVYGIELPCTASVGRRLRISHQHGIVVHPHAVIGDDCVIRHNVTIGGVLGHDDGPVLGDRVDVAVGAVILGNVTIGDGARIGPNAVVMTNVPAGATAFSMPARVIETPSAGAPPNRHIPAPP